MIKLDAEQARALLRNELLISDFDVDASEEFCMKPGESYQILAEDILCALRGFEEERVDEQRFVEWIGIVEQCGENIGFCDEFNYMIFDEIKESDLTNYILQNLLQLRDAYLAWKQEMEAMEAMEAEEGVDVSKEDEGESDEASAHFMEFEEFQDAMTLLSDYIAHAGIFSAEYPVPTFLAKRIVAQFNSDDISYQSEKTQQLFRTCLDQLAEAKDPDAILKRGECYYCGTSIYPKDFYKARDIFTLYYEMTDDPCAANTLGYIYYYGRCNDGVPEYDKAFKYFTIGYAGGMYESAYKLADMFINGYGIEANPEIAFDIYVKQYEEQVKWLIVQEYDCKFADVALRLGKCYRDGTFGPVNYHAAYAHLLQATMAIEQRMATTSYVGDASVARNIKEAMEELLELWHEKELEDVSFSDVDISGITDFPVFLQVLMIDYRIIRAFYEQKEDGSIVLRFSYTRRRDDPHPPKILFTYPDAGYCNMIDELHIRTAEQSSITVEHDLDTFVFNSADFDPSTNKLTFYLDDMRVATLQSDWFGFMLDMKK